jgi:hypothetical protein
LGLEGTLDLAAFTDLFALQLYPYASVYVGDEGKLGGSGRDRVAGFWRALGTEPPVEPDHLAALLSLYAELCEAERAESRPPHPTAATRARTALLWEHLASWLPVYLTKFAALADGPYAAWAELLREVLEAEVKRTAFSAPLPLHLREASLLPDPDEVGRDAFIGALFAPVRSGIIITRSDLGRAARELGLGLRAGERRFAFDALLRQDAGRVCAWLREESLQTAVRYRAWRSLLPNIMDYWIARAHRTVGVLETQAPPTEVIDAGRPAESHH